MAGGILVATTSAVVMLDGLQHHLTKGQTLAREGHPIVAGREGMWEPLHVHFDTDPEGAEEDTPPPPEPEPEPQPEAKDVRAWAAENDIDVPARGKIPADVVEAYKAARSGT